MYVLQEFNLNKLMRLKLMGSFYSCGRQLISTNDILTASAERSYLTDNIFADEIQLNYRAVVLLCHCEKLELYGKH